MTLGNIVTDTLGEKIKVLPQLQLGERLRVTLGNIVTDPLRKRVKVWMGRSVRGGKKNSDKDSEEDSKEESKEHSKEEDQDVLDLEKHHVVTTPSKEKPPPNLLIGANTPLVNTPKRNTTTPIPMLPSSTTSSM